MAIGDGRCGDTGCMIGGMCVRKGERRTRVRSACGVERVRDDYEALDQMILDHRI